MERIERARREGFLIVVSPDDPNQGRWKAECTAHRRPYIVASEGRLGGMIEVDLQPMFSGLRDLAASLIADERGYRWVGFVAGPQTAAIEVARDFVQGLGR